MPKAKKSASAWDRRAFRRLNVRLGLDHPIHLWWYPRRRPGRGFDMHYACEVGVVCRGEIVRQYRDCALRLGPGEVWLCGQWEPHGMEIVRTPCQTLAFAVLPEMLASGRFPEAPGLDWAAPFAAPPDRRPRVNPRDFPAVLDLIGYLKHRVRAEGGQPPPLLLRFVLLELLRLLLKDWRPAAAVAHEPTGSRVNQAVELVFSREGGILADEAAGACGMSRSHFDRVFPRTMGVSFPVFALRRRLHGVAEQLLATQEPLKTIAARWGFADASHLLRRFVELFGCTPNEYRRTAVARSPR